MGGADEGSAAEGLLRERAPRCDGGRRPRPVRPVLRYQRRPGLRLRRRRRQLERDRAGPARGVFGRGADTVVIQVVLPRNLQGLAGTGRVVELDVSGPVTQRSVLDALEARYPALLGTIRDPGTKR